MRSIDRMASSDTFGFYINSVFLDRGLRLAEDHRRGALSGNNVIASRWLKGEELMAGRAAVVSIDMNPGKIVLFGYGRGAGRRPATFPLLFNALYLSALGDAATKVSN
jgi:hypothetical protein